MNSPASQTRRNLEKVILERLAEISNEVAAMEVERQSLIHSLAALRKNSNKNEVGRINSDQRILIELSIIDFLSGKNYLTNWKDIYKEAKKVKPDLKATTFRTYLNRLKEKGYLYYNSSPSGWGIINK